MYIHIILISGTEEPSPHAHSFLQKRHCAVLQAEIDVLEWNLMSIWIGNRGGKSGRYRFVHA